MSETTGALLGRYRQRCDNHLEALLGAVTPFPAAGAQQLEGFREACLYSLRIGGKRVRPALLYGAAAALGDENHPGLDHAACALEFIHTYSLIHDDLPAMDDDDLRRGQPSLHRATDEATAILAGDALQAGAFELLANAPGTSAEARLQMVKSLAAASGAAGMVGGQYLDIAATGTDMGPDQLRTMHSLKTGALIRSALHLGALALEADDAQLRHLDTYGRHIGLAFQVIDDVLDVEGDAATLGKTGGKDSEAGKPTYVSLLGLEGARAEAEALLGEALAALDSFDGHADGLRGIARYIVERDR